MINYPLQRRGMSLELITTGIVILVTLAYGGYWLWGKYASPKQTGDPPYISQPPTDPSNTLTNDEVLAKLLAAVDRRDYATVETYANALFAERKDLDLEPTINGLRDPVIRAAINGDVQLFNALLVAKPAFGGFDERGRRPIHLAASGDHHEAVQWLIENVSAKINDPIVGTRLTPLHLAAGAGATATVRLLIELEADHLAASAKGQLPLHYAVARGSHPGVSAYLEAVSLRALPNGIMTPDANGDTPLHLAARRGDNALAQTLLAAGADKSIPNSAGARPCDIAYNAAHDNLAHILEP